MVKIDFSYNRVVYNGFIPAFIYGILEVFFEGVFPSQINE